MAMQTRVVRVRKLTDQGGETDLEQTTPAQRLGMMWELAVDAWAFTGESLAESRLPRHAVRLVRRGERHHDRTHGTADQSTWPTIRGRYQAAGGTRGAAGCHRLPWF